MSEELPEGWAEAPDGWTIASVRGVVDRLQYGISTKADAVAGTGTPILRMGNIQDGRLDISDLKFVPRSKALDDVLVARGDILFNRTNSPELVGKSAVIDTDDEMVFASYLIRLRAKPGVVDPQYLCWWINSAWGREWAARVRTDGVSQSNINGTKLGEMPLPLAPAPEQRRIVTAVEALLEQVNRARERLDRVPLILKRFRQAVLAAACSGRLTEEWRQQRPSPVLSPEPESDRAEADAPFELPSSWRWVRLGRLGAFINGDRSKNYPSKEHRVARGIPFINAGHLKAGVIDMTEMDYITQERLDLLRGGKVQDGDILYCLRGSLGKAAIVTGLASGAIASSLLILRINRLSCSERYIFDYLTSPLGADMIKKYDNGSAQPNLSAADVGLFMVPLAPLDEQTGIVRQVERLLSLADTIERRVQTATAGADKLPQAILSKAFSGELVTTEADLARAEGRTYETADELLARVAIEKEEGVEAKSSRRAPKARGRARGSTRNVG